MQTRDPVICAMHSGLPLYVYRLLSYYSWKSSGLCVRIANGTSLVLYDTYITGITHAIYQVVYNIVRCIICINYTRTFMHSTCYGRTYVSGYESTLNPTLNLIPRFQNGWKLMNQCAQGDIGEFKTALNVDVNCFLNYQNVLSRCG